MKKERFIFKKLPLNIQLFAEGNDGSGNADNTGNNNPQSAPKTYSEEEYKKLQDDLAKMKASFDKASSELADSKRQIKEKMSEEEKKKLEDAEKSQKFVEMEKELQRLKMKSVLASSFEEKDIDEITEAVISNDYNKVVDLIAKVQNEFKTKAENEAKLKFSKSGKIPGGNDNGSGEDDKIAELAKAQSSKKGNPNNDAWNKFKNR